MSINETLFSILSQDAGVIALVASRIYPHLAPEGVANPVITFQAISTVPTNLVDGGSQARNHRVQIEAWANTPKQADSVADAIEAALDGIGYIVFRRQDQDPETQEYSVTLDWKRWTT